MTQKSTKQFLLALLVLPLICVTKATIAQTKVGIKAGVNFSNVTMKDDGGHKTSTQSMPGLQLGLTADIPVTDDFFIQPGLQYSGKGFKQETGGFYGSASNFEVKASYIELPVYIVYMPIFAGGHLMMGAGPYIGYGNGGNWKSDSSVAIDDMMIGNKGDVIFRNNAANGGSLESYTYGRPLDYGAGFLLGFEFLANLSAQLNAQVGLANLEPHFDGFQRESKLKNTGFGISLGYKF